MPACGSPVPEWEGTSGGRIDRRETASRGRCPICLAGQRRPSSSGAAGFSGDSGQNDGIMTSELT